MTETDVFSYSRGPDTSAYPVLFVPGRLGYQLGAGRHIWEILSVSGTTSLDAARFSMAKVEAHFEYIAPQPPKDVGLDRALHYLRTTPHRPAGRSPEMRQRMIEAIRDVERLPLLEGPTDLSKHLDDYLYGDR